MYTLNPDTKARILKRTGLSVEEMIHMDVDEIDGIISKKIGKPLEYQPINDDRLVGRGSAYVANGRLMNVKRADEVLSKV